MSQIRLTGNICDEENSPLPYVSMRLMQDSIEIQGTCTNSLGNFSFSKLSQGKYLLDIFYLGKNRLQETIFLKKDTNICRSIKDAAYSLDEIVVKANKPTLKKKADRLVFNVKNSPFAKNNNAVELLKYIPMVRTKDDEISIIGKNKAGVLINGKLSYLNVTDLMNYLKSIQASDIIEIEVITTPPAKYDAEGNVGYINIILKKDQNKGWNGNTNLSYTQRSYAGTNNYLSLNYHSPKVGIYNNISYRNNKGKINENERISQLDALQASSTDRIDKYTSFNVNSTIEYQITPKGQIGATYNFGRNTELINSYNNFDYYSSESLDSTLVTISKHSGNSLSHTVNAFYEYKIDSLGKKISLIGNFMHYTPDKTIDFTTQNNVTNRMDIVHEPNSLSDRIITGQTDIELPFKMFTIEIGGKYSDICNKSSISYLNKDGDNYIKDPHRSNGFSYYEKNAAGYLSLSKNISKNLSMQAGLRYEYTTIKGISSDEEVEKNKDSYNKWFPTIYIMYKLDDKQNLSANYSRRINRPFFRAINPFKWYTNPNVVDCGNPLLRPSFNDNIETNYTYNNNLSIMVYYQINNDAYDQVTYIMSDNSLFSTYENIYDNKRLGINTNYTIYWSKWINTYLEIAYDYSKSSIKDELFDPQNGSSFDYRINNLINLDKKKRYQLSIGYSQTTSQKKGDSYTHSYANLNMTFTYSIHDLVFKVYANDILKQDILKREKLGSNNSQFYHNYYDSRYFNISLAYKFGENRKKKKTILFHEQNRI